MFHSTQEDTKKRNIFQTGTTVRISELGEVIGLTRQHMTRLCRGGKIPEAYQTKGGHWRIRWSLRLAAMCRPKELGQSERSDLDQLRHNLQEAGAKNDTASIRSIIKKVKSTRADINAIKQRFNKDASKALRELQELLNEAYRCEAFINKNTSRPRQY